MKPFPFDKPYGALPGYTGGKRKLMAGIFQKIDQVVPAKSWQDKTFVDVFAGACSVTMAAKALGFKAVYANDWSYRSQVLLEALLINQQTQLLKDNLLYLTQPLPANTPGFVMANLVPKVFSTRHGDALDRIWYWAQQYENKSKRALGLLLLWHLVQHYVCIPTSIGSSNRPYAEVLDGIRSWEGLNPKRFMDSSFPRLLKPRWQSQELLRCRINAGVFKGSPVKAYRQDACDFVSDISGDIAYFDPPYAGTLSYERTFQTLDAVLEGKLNQDKQVTSPFTKDVNAFIPLLQNASHIPVWVISYGNRVIELSELIAFIQNIAPDRIVQGYAQHYQHLSHVSKNEDCKELLIVAYQGS